MRRSQQGGDGVRVLRAKPSAVVEQQKNAKLSAKAATNLAGPAPNHRRSKRGYESRHDTNTEAKVSRLPAPGHQPEARQEIPSANASGDI